MNHVWRVIYTLVDGSQRTKSFESLSIARKVMKKSRKSGMYKKVQVGYRQADQYKYKVGVQR